MQLRPSLYLYLLIAPPTDNIDTLFPYLLLATKLSSVPTTYPIQHLSIYCLLLVFSFSCSVLAWAGVIDFVLYKKLAFSMFSLKFCIFFSLSFLAYHFVFVFICVMNIMINILLFSNCKLSTCFLFHVCDRQHYIDTLHFIYFNHCS